MSHVMWPHLLPLSLRLHAADGLLHNGEPFEVLTLDRDAKAVWEEFETLCEGQLADAGRDNRSEQDADDEGPALDAYFLRVKTELNRRMSPRATASREAKALLDSLTSSLSEPVCPACCEHRNLDSTTSACRWTRSSQAADTAALSERGWCLKSVRELHEFAKEAASSAYVDACDNWTPSKVHLHTSHCDFNHQLDLAVNAYVNEDDTTPIEERHLTLSFAANDVVTDDYLAIAYLLMHEYVAHGYCGVDIEDADAGVSLPFHEGWMDCAAAYVAENALRDHPGRFGEIADSFIRQMHVTRVARLNFRRVGCSVDAQAWVAGVRAFDTLEHLFRFALIRSKLNSSSALFLARQHMVSLSLAINASSLSHRDRADFVRSINTTYGRTTAQLARQQAARNSQVFDFIDEFLERRDCLKFVTEVSLLL